MPKPTSVTFAAATVQTAGVFGINVTVSAELAVAVNAIGVTLKFCELGPVKVMV